MTMRQADKHPRYQEIPTLADRSKKLMFLEIKNWVWKKLQGWKEKRLLRPCKEVFLKYVILVIPTYLMGTYIFQQRCSNYPFCDGKILVGLVGEGIKDRCIRRIEICFAPRNSYVALASMIFRYLMKSSLNIKFY